MGRKKILDDGVLGSVYNKCYQAIKDNRPQPVLSATLAKTINEKPSRISAALQYGRRAFAEGRLKPQHWIMGGPKGLFLPDSDEATCAYIVQNVKDILSRTRTQRPLYDYAMKAYPDKLIEAFNMSQAGDDADSIRYDMNPWEVFQNIMDEYGYTEYEE